MEKCSDSERLACLRLPLIVAVVYIHAYGGSYGIESIGKHVTSQVGLQTYYIITELISQFFARVAVPLFFIMSGYFLFLKFSLNIQSYKKCIKSRFSTLVIPYLFWNAAILFLFLFFQTFSLTKVFFSSANIISNFSFFDYLNALFGVTGYPIAYQFWFIRDLILLVVLSPVIYLAINSVLFPLLFTCLTLLWMTNEVHVFMFPAVESILFFAIGGYFAIKFKSLFVLDNYIVAVLILCAIMLLISLYTNSEYQFLFVKIYILLGSVIILAITRYLPYFNSLKCFLVSVSGASFFVFCTHEPLLTFVKKISVKCLPTQVTYFHYLVLYVSVPVLVVSLLVLFYFLIRRFFPKLLLISVGR